MILRSKHSQKRQKDLVWKRLLMMILFPVDQVLPILLEQCDVVATRMRRKGKKCISVSVTFRTLDFKNKSHQTTLPNATDTTDEIYKKAKKLFTESWKGNRFD